MTPEGTPLSTLRLVMFTPARQSSAIGRMAALVTRALLAAGHKVTVVRTEASHLQSAEIHDFSAPVIDWNNRPEVLRHVSMCDATIYQIGNHYGFHEGGLQWLAECPGLVCLHDFFLGHLFTGWAETRRVQANAVLRAWYDLNEPDEYFKHAYSEAIIALTSATMPMTEWICAQADAVITHSQWGCSRVMKSCPGPVRVVPLAYDAQGAVAGDTADTLATRAKPAPSGGQQPPWKLITIGHINPNKRVGNVIRAIGHSDLLKARVSYELLGEIEADMRASLSQLANDLGVSLTILGPVDDTTLGNAIQQSDAVSCLRWPALEAASASAIESMLHGKAVIVTDTGFYRELPDDCVIKISPLNETDEIQTALESMLRDPETFLILAAKAKTWATKTFTGENYAQQLVDTLISSSRANPSRDAIAFFFNQHRSWSGKSLTSSNTPVLRELDIFAQITPKI